MGEKATALSAEGREGAAMPAGEEGQALMAPGDLQCLYMRSSFLPRTGESSHHWGARPSTVCHNTPKSVHHTLLGWGSWGRGTKV